MKKYIKPGIAIYECETLSICAESQTIPVSPNEAYEDACSKRRDNSSSTNPDLWGYEDDE